MEPRKSRSKQVPFCIKCKIEKTLQDFYKNATYCKDCERKRSYVKENCICGRQYTHLHKSRHEQSNYHKKRVLFINN